MFTANNVGPGGSGVPPPLWPGGDASVLCADIDESEQRLERHSQLCLIVAIRTSHARRLGPGRRRSNCRRRHDRGIPKSLSTRRAPTPGPGGDQQPAEYSFAYSTFTVRPSSAPQSSDEQGCLRPLTSSRLKLLVNPPPPAPADRTRRDGAAARRDRHRSARNRSAGAGGRTSSQFCNTIAGGRTAMSARTCCRTRSSIGAQADRRGTEPRGWSRREPRTCRSRSASCSACRRRAARVRHRYLRS